MTLAMKMTELESALQDNPWLKDVGERAIQFFGVAATGVALAEYFTGQLAAGHAVVDIAVMSGVMLKFAMSREARIGDEHKQELETVKGQLAAAKMDVAAEREARMAEVSAIKATLVGPKASVRGPSFP